MVVILRSFPVVCISSMEPLHSANVLVSKSNKNQENSNLKVRQTTCLQGRWVSKVTSPKVWSSISHHSLKEYQTPKNELWISRKVCLLNCMSKRSPGPLPSLHLYDLALPGTHFFLFNKKSYNTGKGAVHISGRTEEPLSCSRSSFSSRTVNGISLLLQPPGSKHTQSCRSQ
jgi:hypothetical protein